MPTYCEPPPGNMKPSRTGSSGTSDVALRWRSWSRERRERQSSTSVAVTTRRWRIARRPVDERVGDIAPRSTIGVRGEVVGEADSRGVERRGGAGADSGEDLLRDRDGGLGVGFGCLLDDDVGVGAADAERADAGAAGDVAGPGIGSRRRGRRASASMSINGLGAVWLASGGSVRWRSACTTLIRLAAPAAVSRWPMFGFVDVTRQKPRSAVEGPEGLGRRRRSRSGRRLRCPCRGPRTAGGRAPRDRRPSAPRGRRRRGRRRSGRGSRPCATPSLLIAVPLITASTGSPSVDGIGEPAQRDDGDAARQHGAVPNAASNARQTPSGARISPSWNS